MRHLRRIVLAALAVALCAAPVASAQGPAADDRGVVVVPAQARWWGEFWAQIYSLPVPENPFAGNGNPCLTVGHNVIEEVGRPCTIEQGTAFTLGFGTAWSNVEDPFPQTEAEQRAAALAFDQANVAEVHVTVDGGTPVDIRRPRFEHFSPQRTVQLPADNFLGVAAQTITLTAHGWTAAVRNLPPGQHTIVQDVVFADGDRGSASHIVTVLHRHADNSDPRDG
jgi:hypothetical protein